METPQRTFVKATLWSLLGLAVMCVVGLIMTGSARVGGAIAVINTGVGLMMYIAYERIWSRINWGKTCD